MPGGRFTGGPEAFNEFDAVTYAISTCSYYSETKDTMSKDEWKTLADTVAFFKELLGSDYEDVIELYNSQEF